MTRSYFAALRMTCKAALRAALDSRFRENDGMGAGMTRVSEFTYDSASYG